MLIVHPHGHLECRIDISRLRVVPDRRKQGRSIAESLEDAIVFVHQKLDFVLLVGGHAGADDADVGAPAIVRRVPNERDTVMRRRRGNRRRRWNWRGWHQDRISSHATTTSGIVDPDVG